MAYSEVIKFYSNSIFTKKRHPVTNVYPHPIFILLSIAVIKEFAGGSFTDRIIGHTYECVDTIDYRHFKVKIEGQTTPLMTNDALQELRNSGKKVYVEFVNCTVLPYISQRTNSLEDSFKANDIKRVEKVANEK